MFKKKMAHLAAITAGTAGFMASGAARAQDTGAVAQITGAVDLSGLSAALIPILIIGLGIAVAFKAATKSKSAVNKV